MANQLYPCTHKGCRTVSATIRERDAHAQHEHHSCPHGCGQCFVTTTGLGRHAKACIENPDRTGKLHCSHQGCTVTYSSGEYVRLAEHEALLHIQCACGSHFTERGLRHHQPHCGVYLASRHISEGSFAWHCDGCGEAIPEGMHYLRQSIEFQTRMPVGYVAEHETDPTTFELTLHGPECFILWAQNAALVEDVFGSNWLTEMRRFQVKVDGRERWVSAGEAAQLLASGDGVSLTNMVREADGLVRPSATRDFEHLRRHMSSSVQVA